VRGDIIVMDVGWEHRELITEGEAFQPSTCNTRDKRRSGEQQWPAGPSTRRLLGSNVGRTAREFAQVMPLNTFPWVVIVFGWPAVIASLALVLTGVVLGRWRVALFGAFVACPFLLYLLASPGTRWLSLIAGVLYLGSARAVAQSQRVLALAMATPFVVLAGSVAWLVLSQ
jgi:hypothetical protein